ncbi:MAG: hypothetical protein SCH98_14375 [Deferrisomatales bacterium]|nr:hypothetical protein [Deferrisomatales bacterium]
MDAAAAISMSVVAYKTRLMFERMRGPGGSPSASPDTAAAPHAPGAT